MEKNSDMHVISLLHSNFQTLVSDSRLPDLMLIANVILLDCIVSFHLAPFLWRGSYRVVVITLVLILYLIDYS